MNDQKSSYQLISELTQAFERLPIKDDQNNHLNNLIEILANGMYKAVHTPYSNHFIDKPASLIPELEGLLKRTRDLEQFLSKIHQSTISAIHDVNARAPLEQACQKMIPALEIALSLNASHDEKRKKDEGGRPPNYRAIQLSDILARNYLKLTGKKPVISVGPVGDEILASSDFITLVDDVFGILGVDANPEYFAKQAIENLTEKTPLKN